VLVGLQGTVGNIAGMISPVLGGTIVARTGSWDANFYVIAGLLGVGMVLWTTMADGEPLRRAAASRALDDRSFVRTES